MQNAKLNAQAYDLRAGGLANARMMKANAWRALKAARYLLRTEPMAGNRYKLRLEVLRLQAEHSRCVRREQGILASIADDVMNPEG